MIETSHKKMRVTLKNKKGPTSEHQKYLVEKTIAQHFYVDRINKQVESDHEVVN